MNARWTMLAVAVPAALTLACGDQPIAPPARGPAVTANWMNNPDNGNFRIERFEGGVAVCWTDPDTGLRACHSTTPLGGGTEPDCGPQQDLDPVAHQHLGIDDFAEIHVNVIGDVFITVRDVTQSGDCFGAQLVAEGMGQFHYTDNDADGTPPWDNNANAWGFMATGVLTTPGGEAVQYHGVARWTYSNVTGLALRQSSANVH